MNKPARAGFNSYTPPFRPIDVTQKIKLNDIQLNDTVKTGKANIQIFDEGAATYTHEDGTQIVYYWVKKGDTKYKGSVDMTNLNGVWAVRVGNATTGKYYDPDPTKGEIAELEVGESVQIYANEGDICTMSGAVGEESVAVLTRTARDSFNNFGNPFPAAMPMNNIQMDENVKTGKANIQILDEGAATYTHEDGTQIVYYWVKKGDTKYKGSVDMTGLNGVWAVRVGNATTGKYYDPDPEKGEVGTLEPGQGVLLNGTLGQTYWAICPYSLKGE